MATFSKLPFSGSTNGKGILVSAFASPGTLIHTSASGSAYDEVWLYAMNTHTAAVKLTVEYGGTGLGDIIEISIPSESGLILITPGLYLNNSQVVRAWAGTASLISIYGYVNRVS